MQIEIDDTIADTIIVEALKKDFIGQQNDISRLLSKSKPLERYEQEDLWNFKEVSDALATILRYYMYRPDADKFISENSVNTA